MRRLELICGATRPLVYVQQLLVTIAAANLLFLCTTLSWTAFSLLALFTVNIGGLWYMARRQSAGTLLVREDGTVRIRQGADEHSGTLIPSAWVSRWLCVLQWKPMDAHTARACLVCSWANPLDDYRRLLVRLRLGQEA